MKTQGEGRPQCSQATLGEKTSVGGSRKDLGVCCLGTSLAHPKIHCFKQQIQAVSSGPRNFSDSELDVNFLYTMNLAHMAGIVLLGRGAGAT